MGGKWLYRYTVIPLYRYTALPLSVKTYFLGNKRECETVKKPIAPRIPQTRLAATSVLPAAVATVAELVVEVLPDVANFCLNDSHLLPPFVVLLRNQPQRFLMVLDC